MTAINTGDTPSGQQLTDAFPLFVRKAADSLPLVSSTTLQNDTDLLSAVAASTTYNVDLWMIINTGTVPDFKFGWTGPAGATFDWSVQEGTPGALAAVLQGPFTIASVPPINGAAADQIVVATGTLVTSVTAGTLRLQWAQNTSTASNTIVKAGSRLRLWKMA